MLPNVVLFQGSADPNTQGLWETNGTATGTFLVTNGPFVDGFRPNALSLMDLTVFGNQVLFSGRNASGKYGLWTTDATAAGTMELTGIAGAGTGTNVGLNPSDLTVFGGEVLFNGVDNTAGNVGGLWVTNGTGPGTHEITGISGAASTGVDPTDITVFGSQALFGGVDTAGHHGLWMTNGSAAGTHEITGIGGAAASGVDPTDITVFGGEALFNGADSTGRGLWVTNGTTATEVSGTSGLNPTDITVFGSEVLFAGKDASNNIGLWMWTGTGAPQELTGISGAVANLAPSDITVYNGKVLFSGLASTGGRELFVMNGTGSHVLTVAGSSTYLFNPNDLVVYNGQVLFQGTNSSSLQTLWTMNSSLVATEIAPIPERGPRMD